MIIIACVVNLKLESFLNVRFYRLAHSMSKTLFDILENLGLQLMKN